MIENSTPQSTSAPFVIVPIAPSANREVNERIERHLDDTDRLIADDRMTPATCPLSIILPVYNERNTIRQIVERVAALPLYKEILIVDDASTDGTGEIVEQLADMPEVKVMRHERNRGKGAALQTALDAATGDVVVIQDADLEYDPTDIVMLVRPIFAKRCDVVYGSRFLAPINEDTSWLHRAGNRLLTRLSNLFTGQRLTDMETCYKAFRRSVLKNIQLKQNRFGIEPELTAKLARRGHRIYEMPVSYNARGYAEGKKIGPRDALNTLWCIVRYGIAD
jgi:glycosyltransferase involved in cell wall biosynthesis